MGDEHQVVAGKKIAISQGYHRKMQEETMSGQQQDPSARTSAPHVLRAVLKGEANKVGTDSAWMRRHLRDSIYLWACGEKADDEDDDPKLSDRLIGWLVLFMQGFAYTMLIVLARATSSSDTDSSGDDSVQSGYLLPSVTGAMYLLVASTAHDLRAGFSLLVDGSCAGHRGFGIGLLIVYGIMISAAMTVLVSTSDDSASVVLNAVTVLFVADLDEKALQFLMTIPQRWRLFWAIESIGISFVLAVVAIYYIGDASTLLEEDNDNLQTFPTWFVWITNPAAVTLCSYVLSSTLQAGCEVYSDAWETAEEPTFSVMVSSTFEVTFAAMKKAKYCFGAEPCFYVALAMWLAHGVASLFFMIWGERGFPIVVLFDSTRSASAHDGLEITNNKRALVYSNVVLVIGLALKALRVILRRHERVVVVPVPRYASDTAGPRERVATCADSRVPSLLVGWGIGYWAMSLLYVSGCSWHGGGCGWDNAPIVVTIFGYVVLAPFVVCEIFMVAEVNFLGTRFGAFIKPAVDILQSRRTVEYWIMASVFRDILVLWLGFCDLLRSPFDYPI